MKKISIIILSIVVLFSAGAVVYTQVPTVQNAVKVNVMNPTEYMLDVEENNVTSIDFQGLNNTENMAESYTVDYAVSPAIIPGLSGTINLDVYKQGVLNEVLVSFGIGENKIDFDAILDNSTATAFGTMPGATDTWFKFSPFGDLTQGEIADFSAEIGKYDFTKRLNRSNVEELADRYIGVALKYLNDVTVDKKTGVIKSKFYFKDIPDLVYEIAKTVQNDKLMKDILTDIGIWNDFDGAMNSITKEDFMNLLTQSTTIPEGYLDVKTYVNKKGEITKREFSFKEDYVSFDLENKKAEVKFGVVKVNISEGLLNVSYENSGMTITDALTIRYEKKAAPDRTITIPTQNITEDEMEFNNSIDISKFQFFEDLATSFGMLGMGTDMGI
ncbi:MAG: hypothetical protein LBL93_04600 [Ruminococcus sp.]|jgi:hypothetical protein|nr:hypothetical protein [Ruminococcus sp.]